MVITRKELIKKYIDFFKSKKHNEIKSSSLIPENDPTVLFTTAGMHPLVPYLLGEKHPKGKRLTNVQRCIRTVDIEEVGDSCHHTFFEMLGNWSLGDYFKDAAIRYTFEFLTMIDINLTTGYKPKIILIETMGISFLISIVAYPMLIHNKTENTLLIKYYYIIVSLLQYPVQLLHLYYNHAGRWNFKENWTHPGKYLESLGPYIFDFLLIIFLGIIGAVIGTIFGVLISSIFKYIISFFK